MRVSNVQTGTFSGPAGSGEGTHRHSHRDPRLSTYLSDVVLPIDATEPHEYAAEWVATGVRPIVDGAMVKTGAQVLTYHPLLMVGLFEFPESDRREPAAYPKQAIVRSVLGTG